MDPLTCWGMITVLLTKADMMLPCTLSCRANNSYNTRSLFADFTVQCRPFSVTSLHEQAKQIKLSERTSKRLWAVCSFCLSDSSWLHIRPKFHTSHVKQSSYFPNYEVERVRYLQLFFNSRQWAWIAQLLKRSIVKEREDLKHHSE